MDTEALKNSLVGRFIEVTRDRLQTIQLAALELEKPGSASQHDSLARELHTMKGESRMLGLLAIGQLSHAAEDVLTACREGTLAARAATDLLLQVCDRIGETLEDPAGAKEGTPETLAIAQALADAAGKPLQPLRPKPPPARPSASGRAKTGARDRASHPTPLARADQAFVWPSGPSNESTGDAGRWESPSPSGTDANLDEPPERRTVERSTRVSVEALDAMGRLAGDLLVESARASLRGGGAGQLFERFARLGDQLVRLAEKTSLATETKRRVVEFENDLHSLRDDAFRFVRVHADGLNTLHGTLTQLADHVTSARLVPLASVFEAFPRAVREMAHAQGKQIELSVENSGAGVDRPMVADVRDALVHLIRNAADHGIELQDERARLGKAEVGQVRLRAHVDGDMVRVEVEDDGRGIDPAALRELALKKGVVSATQAAAMSEREQLALIFRSGFSTKDAVGELSGRGVGMDVVKRKIESLGGSVAVVSHIGRGTCVSMRLPQSLALVRVLLFRLGDDVYGLPAADVEAVARIAPEARLEIMGTLAVMHREKPIVLSALGPLLGLNGGPRNDRPLAVVLRHGDDRAALVVDGFVGEREVAVKPIGGEFLKGVSFIAGSAALEDGRIAVLLHVPDVMGEVRRVARPVADQTAMKRLRVLLVDDSPIARATESALVRALGHDLEEAQDGEEAWVRLQAQSFDLVVTDVQMPKLDGFALTRRIKQSPAFERLPVIILSSLASPEDKRRGLDAGADAYLIKGELGVDSLALAFERLT